MKTTPGKLAGMKAVSNDRGVIAAAAMDQRGSLKKALGHYATDAGLEEFKIHVTEVLTQHASAILLDPEWGLPAAKRRAKGSGLLLAYEKTGYDKALPGRLPDLLDLWSAKRLKEAGADCVKILLYYTPYDDTKINDHKQAWTERIGDECKANDIPFFLELVGYKEGIDEKGAEYAKLKPEVVAKSMEEFSKDRYGVDVLKVEIPVNLQFVEGAKSFKGTDGLHQEGSARSLPRRRRRDQQAVHLSVGRREQSGIHRGPGVCRRIGRQVQRRALRTRHLERRHPDLRREGRSRFPRVAGRRRREEHRQREQRAEGRHPVVQHLRRAGSGRRQR